MQKNISIAMQTRFLLLTTAIYFGAIASVNAGDLEGQKQRSRSGNCLNCISNYLSIKDSNSNKLGLQIRKLLVISIDDNNRVYVEQQEIALDKLTSIVKNAKQNSPNILIVIYASENARYGRFIEVLERIKKTGADIAIANIRSTPPDLIPLKFVYEKNN